MEDKKFFLENLADLQNENELCKWRKLFLQPICNHSHTKLDVPVLIQVLNDPEDKFHVNLKEAERILAVFSSLSRTASEFSLGVHRKKRDISSSGGGNMNKCFMNLF
jgi:hypothetical protein